MDNAQVTAGAPFRHAQVSNTSKVTDVSDGLTTGDAADMLGLSRSSVKRIPRDDLQWWLTPGRHRRYAGADVEAYARDVLGRPATSGSSSRNTLHRPDPQ